MYIIYIWGEPQQFQFSILFMFISTAAPEKCVNIQKLGKIANKIRLFVYVFSKKWSKIPKNCGL